MANPCRCIVHIGLHKTGTTSIQHFLQQNRGRLREYGVHFYQGCHFEQNHVELHAATMRHDRTSTFKMKSGLRFDEAYLRGISHRVKEFLSDTGDDVTLFSAEGLSLLYYSDETDRLAAMLPVGTKIIVYLRNPVDYLRSHKRELEKNDFTGITDKTSHAYIESDSWLIDYGARLRSFRATFGEKNVHIIDYDDACALDGNVIPSFLRQLDLEDKFSAEDQNGKWLNKS